MAGQSRGGGFAKHLRVQSATLVASKYEPAVRWRYSSTAINIIARAEKKTVCRRTSRLRYPCVSARPLLGNWNTKELAASAACAPNAQSKGCDSAVEIRPHAFIAKFRAQAPPRSLWMWSRSCLVSSLRRTCAICAMAP
eukprot:4224940-Prymnesium_polylepis.1